MKNLLIGAVLVSVASLSPAAAEMSPDFQHDLTTGFSTRGDCQTALRWADYDYKRWTTKVERNPGGPAQKELHARFECQQQGSKWYIVQTSG